MAASNTIFFIVNLSPTPPPPVGEATKARSLILSSHASNHDFTMVLYVALPTHIVLLYFQVLLHGVSFSFDGIHLLHQFPQFLDSRAGS